MQELVLSTIALIASVSVAYAGPKEDGYLVVTKWAKAFTDARGQCNRQALRSRRDQGQEAP